MSDQITHREIEAETGIRHHERTALERHAGFPRGTKTDPSLMQARIKFDRRKVEVWRRGIERIRQEIAAIDA
jgi:hypothetical protein